MCCESHVVTIRKLLLHQVCNLYNIVLFSQTNSLYEVQAKEVAWPRDLCPSKGIGLLFPNRTGSFIRR